MLTKSLDSKSFADFVSSPEPVIVDFYATWCGPCRRMSPLVDALSVAHPGRVAKVDSDACRELCSSYNIRSLPTFLVFQNGKVLETLVGGQTAETLAARLG